MAVGEDILTLSDQAKLKCLAEAIASATTLSDGSIHLKFKSNVIVEAEESIALFSTKGHIITKGVTIQQNPAGNTIGDLNAFIKALSNAALLSVCNMETPIDDP